MEIISLESIFGLDFLPRRVVTRRPLENFVYVINHGEPWSIFEEWKRQKFNDFNKVKRWLKHYDEVCKEDKNIVDKPIILNVYSQTCPDLILVDLSVVIRVAVGKQPKNIEQITKDIAIWYIKDPLTIILCNIERNILIFQLQMVFNYQKNPCEKHV